ncbi:PREDICTED: uncharacterized protein LOC106124262 isoform X1 [Papilio xuthus]|uniref:Uncharacterized protein LOC106124262 isoform X1 n=1 Tax=Papilio xuthus TaxID=66420 RepID=A0AAJ6ZNB2_PAPXU|nr:PREDICTED: uncharacterized protein LOC106124262 isoform X1 [Papilio xuthus]
MNFYKCILFIIYIYLSKFIIALESGLKLLGTGLESVSPCAIGLQFYIVVNNTSEQDYEVQLSPEQCCLKSDYNLDCDTINIVGNCLENIPKGTKKILKLVAPILGPYQRRGFCIINFDTKLTNEQKRLERQIIKIDFDTYVENKKQSMDLPYNIKKCNNIDEDPLNNCNPVECDNYYNGRKPYYSKRTKQCIQSPICVSNFISELPEVVLDPISNTCVRGRSILDEDIEFIKSLEKPTNCSTGTGALTISGNDKNNLTEQNLKVTGNASNDTSYTTKFSICEKIHSYMVNNKLTIIVLITVVFMQCCLICVLIFYVTSKCECFSRRKLVSKLYNFTTDVSMTTPLIFSNTDTETTGYKYVSDSSNNIDKKIKSYKSCQKDRNGLKVSMSDDILSKCLTRRDWIDNKYTKSEAIPEMPLRLNAETYNEIEQTTEYEAKKEERNENDEMVPRPSRKISEAKVVFEDERSDKNQNNMKSDRIIKSIVQKVDYQCDKSSKKIDKKGSDSSEKEIKCHSYDCLNTSDPKISKRHDLHSAGNKRKGAISLSTDKGAQACFSNDSIDDFLSERGMMFLGGDDISKYTFSYTSNQPKPTSSSEVSSKTSKNNLVKNMLTMLHRRSKHGISSDPGISMTDNIDVELLHMSHASVFTSSNESECIKELAKQHDSRTSL